MGEQDYSAGRRIYNGASNAPTRGRVDPSGYVDRELNKPKMDQSQSRSGLAQAALRRLGGPSGAPPAPSGGPPAAPGGAPMGMPGLPPMPPVPGMDSTDPEMAGGELLGAPLIITPTGKLQLNPALANAAFSGGMQ